MIFSVVKQALFPDIKTISSLNLIRSVSTALLCQNVNKLQTSHIYSIFSFREKKLFCESKHYFCQNACFNNANKSGILGIQLKKRPVRKSKTLILDDADISQSGFWNVKGLATAEEYNLESLAEDLFKQNLYVTKKINTSGKSFPDVIHAVPKYEIDQKGKDIFFFREGTVVMWNIPELESGNVLKLLRCHEESSYSRSMVQSECEVMPYTLTEKRSHLKEGHIHLSIDSNLDKYTFSNAISQSVKLGIWEASLEHYIDSIEFVTDDLKDGRKIKMTREEVLRKQGQLFALRHFINLSSDLLDTPDFYWENDELESLYQQTCSYFSITKRTRIMNEKINHCVELVELLSSHLSDRHHVRLEWMIIVLIMVEVGFEIIHYLDRYLDKKENSSTTFSDGIEM
ncbi:hypothetical protein HCN44_000420 [Aphidius gifuensis]|uniref:DUF155 domain-containing protein n=1 Tax=Aphidius gifuensis TaxID=684658 RepID=A0A834XNX8_APHGI|nr:required for meiotic nuclear division protein 1 homolog [Aphidius gifuensis]KAF7990615.1 hypothetical protein HCN44_000420 [Aphidius gifuensis]